MERISKYLIDPSEIFNMSTKELKSYIRGASKTLGSRIKRISSSEFSDFSELLNTLEEVEGRIGKISGATKGLNEAQLRRKAAGFSQLFQITETKGQLESEGYDNIKNFFKEPRFTRRFIEGIHRNQKILSKLANKNDKFIRDILGSEQIRQIVEENEGNEPEMYRKLLLATSDELDLWEESEKQAKIVEEWDPVFKYMGDNTWEDPSGNIIDVYSEWKWGED